jgi:transcriptional regulator with XRE-family HTH domain
MPIPDHLRTELGRYSIGQKMRALRLRRSMGLMQLGERTGLSPALLSKLENSKLIPTVPTLLRIAMVFDVTLDHFFQNEHRQRVISITRREEREQ